MESADDPILQASMARCVQCLTRRVGVVGSAGRERRGREGIRRPESAGPIDDNCKHYFLSCTRWTRQHILVNPILGGIGFLSLGPSQNLVGDIIPPNFERARRFFFPPQARCNLSFPIWL